MKDMVAFSECLEFEIRLCAEGEDEKIYYLTRRLSAMVLLPDGFLWPMLSVS